MLAEGGCAAQCLRQEIEDLWIYGDLGDVMPRHTNDEGDQEPCKAMQYAVVLEFTASGETSDYTAIKEDILTVFWQAAGFAEKPRGSFLGMSDNGGSVLMTAIVVVLSTKADTAFVAFEAAITSPAVLTALMEGAGITMTVQEFLDGPKISHPDDDGCRGGTGFGESCGVPILPVVLPIASIVVGGLAWYFYEKQRKGKSAAVHDTSHNQNQ